MNHSFFALFASAALASAGMAQAPYLHRVDALDPLTAPDGSCEAVSISPDGNQVFFFHSSSALLPPGIQGTPGLRELYRRDLRTNALSLVNLDNQQHLMQIGPPSSTLITGPAVSTDGRFVAFLSTTALPGDTDARPDVYVRDMLLGTTELISTTDFTLPQVAPVNGQPRMSGDGRFVVYATQTDPALIVGTPGYDTIVLHDRTLGTTTPIFTVNLPLNSFLRPDPVISLDGSTVAFVTNTPGPTSFSNKQVLKTYDVATGQLTAHTEVGTPFPSPVEMSIDGTGRRIAFTSPLELTSTGTSSSLDIYLLDRLTNVVTLESDCLNGVGGGGYAVAPSLSANGRYLAFQSTHSCFGGPVQDAHVYVKDLQTGLTTMQSINDLGQLGSVDAGAKFANINSSQALSATGERVVFTSTFSNLAGPTKDFEIFVSHIGVFMRERQVNGPQLDVTNLVATQSAALQITGAKPNGVVMIGYSLAGQGPLPTYWGLVDLSPPIAFFNVAADGAGNVTASLPVPAALAGMQVWMKGLDIGLSKPTTSFTGIVQ